MIKIQTNDRLYIDYPVGACMDLAIKFAELTAKAFVECKSFDPVNVINIWCRGSSGAILAALFSQQILPHFQDVYVSHVKKPGEQSHSQRTSYVNYNNVRHVIIDDFISTGQTLRAICEEMERREIGTLHCVIANHVEDIKWDNGAFIYTPDVIIYGGH